jgi:hypothetical protein
MSESSPPADGTRTLSVEERAELVRLITGGWRVLGQTPEGA